MRESKLSPRSARDMARAWWEWITLAAIAIGGLGVIFGKLRPAGGWGQSWYSPWYWECWLLLAAGTAMYVLPMLVGLWKAERKYAPLKPLASRVHAELKAGSGENPAWKAFLAEFERRYPDREVTEGALSDCLRQWWKKLNRGQAI